MKNYKKIKKGIILATAVSLLCGMGLMLLNPTSSVSTILLWLTIILIYAWQVFDEKQEKQERENRYKIK